MQYVKLYCIHCKIFCIINITKSMDGARLGASGIGMLGGAISSPRSISMASISSEGSMESPLVEQEEIAALTHDVRNFKEALGKLRKICHPEWTDAGKFLFYVKHHKFYFGSTLLYAIAILSVCLSVSKTVRIVVKVKIMFLL